MKDKLKNIATPLIKHRQSISPVWFLPFIALLVGVWLVWRSLLDAGPTIKIEFLTGEGLAAQQTEVRYKGIVVGIVKQIDPKPDLSGVIATVEVDQKAKRAKNGIPEDTKFWLVQPKVSLSGISGLNTLMSGNYISVQLGKSAVKSSYFHALENPPINFSEPGLHLTLDAANLGSISEGSLVYYRKFAVGEVVGYSLNRETNRVNINVLIRPEYQYLVNSHSRFWNASGFSVDANLTGIKIQTESVANLLAGGIAFDTPSEEDAKTVENGSTFQLFDDEVSAGATLIAHIYFPSADYLTPGQTQIMNQGLVVGVVRKLNPAPNGQGIIAEIGLKPEVEPDLNEGTQFWLVRPELSAAKVIGLDALDGAYISYYKGSGKPTREFQASLSIPPLPMSTPGLHIVLESSDSGGLSVGSPVLYKKIEVGSVQAIRFSPDKSKVQIDVFITPDYAKLINPATRFWNAAGISVNGNLSNIKIRTGSLASILQGGVLFDQFDKVNRSPAKNGDRFTFYNSRDDAENAGATIEMHIPSASGLNIGTEIRYRGLKVGEITQLHLDQNLQGVTAYASLNSTIAPLLTTGTSLWQVRAQFGLARTANLGTLIGGDYIALRPGEGKPSTTFTVADTEPVETARPTGLNIVLTSNQLGSLKAGDPILYRQIRIGTILGADLSADAENVKIYANIDEARRSLVKRNSHFVNVSGISVNAGLFSGVHIDTQSVETILSGGVVLEETNNTGDAATQGSEFKLLEK